MNKFDKNIKKKLYNADMHVSEGLWASIESQIPVKKERPKYWLLFLLSAIAIPIYVITLHHGNFGQNDKETTIAKISEEARTNQLGKNQNLVEDNVAKSTGIQKERGR